MNHNTPWIVPGSDDDRDIRKLAAAGVTCREISAVTGFPQDLIYKHCRRHGISLPSGRNYRHRIIGEREVGEAIEAAVRAGERCPTNRAFGQRTGMTAHIVGARIKDFARAGRIKVEYRDTARRVRRIGMPGIGSTGWSDGRDDEGKLPGEEEDPEKRRPDAIFDGLRFDDAPAGPAFGRAPMIQTYVPTGER